MNSTEPIDSATPSRRFRWGRFLGLLLLVLGISLLGLRLWAATLVTRAINAQLPRYLSAKANLGGVQLGLLAGRVTLRDLVVQQPEGFQGEPLLRLPRLTVKVRVASLNKPVIEVEEISVEGLTAHLIRRNEGTNGLLNAVALLLPQPARPAEPSAGGAAATPSPRVHIRAIRVEQLGVRYDDSTLAEQTLSLTLTNLNLRVDGLTLDTAGSGGGGDFALAGLRAEILQRERPNAFLQANAKIGVVSTNVPNLNAVVRLTGFSLRNAGPLFKRGVDTTLGGDAFDLKADAAVNANRLDAGILLVMTNGQVWPIKLSGPLNAPSVDRGALGGALLNRPMKSVENLASNLTGAVGTAANGVGEAVGKGLGGAFKTVGTVGSGLFSSAEKILSGDVKGAAKSLGRTARDGAGAAADAVTTTGSGLGRTAGRLGSTAIGADRIENWWKSVPTRAEAAQKEAEDTLENMPFPPVGP